jgi:hypothetical protein
MKVPPEALLADDYIAERRALISADAAISKVEAGAPGVEMRGDTVKKTHLFSRCDCLLLKTPSFYQDRLGTNIHREKQHSE